MEVDSPEQESSEREKKGSCTRSINLKTFEAFTEDQILPSLCIEDLQDHSMIFDEEVQLHNDFDNVFIVIDECSMSQIPEAVSHEDVTTDASLEITNDNAAIDDNVQVDTNNNELMETSDTDDIESNTDNSRRKRKNTESREDLAKKRKIEKHFLRDPCPDFCIKKCTSKFSQTCREAIHKQFWSLSWKEQKSFILNTCARKEVNKKSDDSSRNLSFIYKFSVEGKNELVCKTFFLTTLGFHPKNDKVIFNVLHTDVPLSDNIQLQPAKDGRGKASPPSKIDRSKILEHIERFNPTISHYRREHAPNVRYLPNDLTITMMYHFFKEEFPNFKVSYETYRKILSEENIHFTKLGHEECEICEIHKFHLSDHSKELDDTCDECKKWLIHDKKSKQARKYYQDCAKMSYDSKTLCMSADLQKIIMLPRLECFKSAIFTNRLTSYNETFVPVGKNQVNIAPFAVIWHEGIRERSKEEITSTYHQFFLQHKDYEKIILWLDNCCAQNKNWAFLSYLPYIINSSLIKAQVIEVNYFEPGHTFMSADSFHHQIELSMKKKGKVYDFPEFVSAVEGARNKVNVKVMDICDFYYFIDHTSVKNRNFNHDKTEKVYLTNIVQIEVNRGTTDLKYKTDYNDNFKILNNYLKVKAAKKGIPDPILCEKKNGISKAKKDAILKNICPLIPDDHKIFWQNLPEK